VHTVEIKAGLTPGPDLGVAGEPDQLIQDVVAAFLRVVGVQAHGSVDARSGFGQLDRPARCFEGDADGHQAFNPRGTGACDNVLQIVSEGWVVEMTVAVEKHYF